MSWSFTKEGREERRQVDGMNGGRGGVIFFGATIEKRQDKFVARETNSNLW